MTFINDLTFIHPSRWLIYGPSGSGKSTFVNNLILDSIELFGLQFDTILYCSGQGFPKFNKVNNVSILMCNSFTNSYIDNLDSTKNNLIIIDDNMNIAANDILISDLFTKKSHHKNITVIFLVQNLFPKSKYMRDISISSTYIVLMKNPREIFQIKLLSHQINGEKSNFIIDSYKDATKNKPYSYLLLDLGQTTHELLKVRTNVLSNEFPKVVYIEESVT